MSASSPSSVSPAALVAAVALAHGTVASVHVLVDHYVSHVHKTPSHTDRSGYEAVWNLLITGNEHRVHARARMNGDSFRYLCWMLRPSAIGSRTRGLSAAVAATAVNEPDADPHELHWETSRSRISVEETVLQYLHVTAHRLSVNSVCEYFQRSSHSVSVSIERALTWLGPFYSTQITGVRDIDPVAVKGNPKFVRFINCVGCVDGSHIPVAVEEAKHAVCRNRKGWLSTNVMFAVDFSMRFTYVLAGAEGCANDQRVLQFARERGFSVPHGKYFLGDAGYALDRDVLTPYRGVRYHLQELRGYSNLDAVQPRDRKELFNMRHSMLRNVVERSIGCFKKRFLSMSCPTEFSFEKQVRFVYANAAVHNFCRDRVIEERLVDREFLYVPPAQGDRRGLVPEPLPDVDDDVHSIVAADPAEVVSTSAVHKWRDDISKAMWKDYKRYIQENEKYHPIINPNPRHCLS